MRGYAALITTLIVCTVLTVLSLQGGMSVYLLRLTELEADYKSISRAHAHSCAQIAQFELSADPTYRPSEGGDVVEFAPNSFCKIVRVIEENNEVSAYVSGEYRKFTTVLELRLQKNIISSPSFLVLSFREI